MPCVSGIYTTWTSSTLDFSKLSILVFIAVISLLIADTWVFNSTLVALVSNTDLRAALSPGLPVRFAKPTSTKEVSSEIEYASVCPL